MSTVIQLENISKQYRLGLIGSSTIASDFHRFLAKIRGKEDPTLLVSVENKIDANDGEYVWALRDINFNIEQGEVLGIIGKNGAGKSTLLKILSKVTTPTTGSIKIKGRIASLLEVGTGFHPELSGKENIFLNGAILGMKKVEIQRKFDEIVDFSGVGKYIDTPVKRYSSGMYVRLAFAVAAHLEPEILIVDEVLAVGDAEFQKKALGKMHDISKGQGRTVLFVSHNMTAVKNLCRVGVLLKNGCVECSGQINEVVDYYLAGETIKGILNNYWTLENAPGLENIKVKSAYIKYFGELLTVNTPFDIVTDFWCLNEGFPVNVSMHIFDINGSCVYAIVTENKPLKKGLNQAVFHIPAQLMNDGIYYVNNMFVSNYKSYFYHEHANSFEITEDREASGWHGKWPGNVRPTFIISELKYMEK